MRTLMLGWEFPPANRGGLGIATYGLACALSSQAKIDLILPFRAEFWPGPFRLWFTSVFALQPTDFSQSNPYLTIPSTLENVFLNQVEIYARQAVNIARGLSFDIIHAHDWMTLPAAVWLKKVYHKPLVVHLHTIEMDRSANQAPNPTVFQIEKTYLPAADCVITVSQMTKDRALRFYQLDAQKVKVVHNGYRDFSCQDKAGAPTSLRLEGKKVVLFVGRLTLHKGPDYFIRAAQKVLAKEPKAVFVLAGTGEMQAELMNLAAQLGIADKVFFTGFLSPQRLKALYRRANVYVLTSVAEPFGIAPLEALGQKTPVILSKTAGVTEVMPHARLVDFWDIDALAAKILEVLQYPALAQALKTNGYRQLKQLSWEKAAQKVFGIYQELVASAA